MSLAYANLLEPQNTGSGIGEYILVAPVKDFTEIKCPVAPFTNRGDEVRILEDHVFKTGKKFVKIQLAPGKNQLDAATIGDLGFQKLDIELKVFIAGSYAEAHELVKNLINTPLIVLSPDSNCGSGDFYQLGCDCASAWAKFDFSTGTTLDGVKGYSGTISYQNGYIQVYKGTREVYE